MGGQMGKQVDQAKANGGVRLELDGCELKAIPRKVVNQFPELEELSLQSNGLSELPSAIGKLSRLRSINLNDNGFKSFPECVCKLSNSLEILSMLSNHVSEIPPSIGNLVELQRLVLTDNNIRNIPNEINKLENLALLYLGSNKITAIPPSLGELTNLTMLIMYENELERLPPEIGKMEGLTSLNVSQNKLETLPSELKQLTGLVELLASDNNIKKLPRSLGGGRDGLRTLDLSDNEISSLEMGLYLNLEGLRDLNLSGNNFTDLGEELECCPALEKLELHNNRLQTVPQAIYSMLELKHLTLNDNMIESFPEEFEELSQNFEFFNIANNHAKKKTLDELRKEDVLELMNMAVEGGIFIRHPDKTVMSLSLTQNYRRFLYQDTESKKAKLQTIEAMDIKEVLKGRQTDILKKSGHAHRDEFYFSIVTEKTVENLEANSVEDRDDWVLALEVIMKTIKTAKEKMAEMQAEKERIMKGSGGGSSSSVSTSSSSESLPKEKSRPKRQLGKQKKAIPAAAGERKEGDEENDSSSNLSSSDQGGKKKPKSPVRKMFGKRTGSSTDLKGSSGANEEEKKDEEEKDASHGGGEEDDEGPDLEDSQGSHLADSNSTPTKKKEKKRRKIKLVDKSPKKDSKKAEKEGSSGDIEKEKKSKSSKIEKKSKKSSSKLPSSPRRLRREKEEEEKEEAEKEEEEKEEKKEEEKKEEEKKEEKKEEEKKEEEKKEEEKKATGSGTVKSKNIQSRMSMFEKKEEVRVAPLTLAERKEISRREREKRLLAKEEARKKVESMSEEEREELEKEQQEKRQANTKFEEQKRMMEEKRREREEKKKREEEEKKEASLAVPSSSSQPVSPRSPRSPGRLVPTTSSEPRSKSPVRGQGIRARMAMFEKQKQEEAARSTSPQRKPPPKVKLTDDADEEPKESGFSAAKEALIKNEEEKKQREEEEKKRREEEEKQRREEEEKQRREEEERQKEEEKKREEERKKKEEEREKEEEERKKEEEERKKKEEEEKKAEEEDKEEAEKKKIEEDKEEEEKIRQLEEQIKKLEEEERKKKEGAERKKSVPSLELSGDSSSEDQKEDGEVRKREEEEEEKEKEDNKKKPRKRSIPDFVPSLSLENLNEEQPKKEEKKEEIPDTTNKENTDLSQIPKEHTQLLATNVARTRARPTAGRRPPTRASAADRLKQQQEKKKKEEQDRQRRQQRALVRVVSSRKNFKDMANQGGMTPRITPRQSQERIDRQTAAKREMLVRAVSLRQKGPMQKITVEPGKEGEENAKPSLGAEAKAKAKQHEKVGQGRPHRLYCCKGKRRIRVVLVDTVPEVLNQGDVYILDCIKTLYVWHGNKHSPLKKAKGVEITARLRSGDRKGAKVVNLFSRDGQDDDPEFWKQLGADPSARENIPPADITKDLLFEKEIDERTTLYRLLESDELLGKNERGYELDRVGAPGEKLIQKMLDTNFCYVLDCPEGEGFAWVGKKSPNPARVAVMQHLRLMFSSRPEWCYVSRNVEGGESLFFKEKFASWADNTPMGGGKRLVPFGKKREDKAKKPAKTDVLKLHSNIPHEEEMVDEGQGEVERWRMVDKALQEEPQDSYLNHFWSDESYNVLYTWKKGNALRYIIYYWQGRTCHIQDKGLAALMINEVVKVVKSRSGEPVQKRQVQMDETIHFHYVFKKRFVVHQGKQHGPTDDFPPALYHVSGFNNLPGTIKAVEVDCKVSRLSPQGVFILHTPKEQWVWEGSGSRRSIRDAALDFCKEISKIKKTKHQGEPLVVKQGKELQSFWDVIPGGRSYFASAKHLNRPLKVRMFKASSGTGTFIVDEMYPFSQAKLDPENVFIVDGVHEVYVWCGPWSNAADATKAMAVAVEYVEKASDGRLQSTPVRRLEGGRETADFAALFHAWKGETIDSEEGSGDNVLEILKELNRTYTYKELLNNPPKGLEKTRLESYLSDEEFEQIFDRTKEEFYALPEWIRTKRRQDVGLY